MSISSKRKYARLTEAEKTKIFTLAADGISTTAIAKALDKSWSTIHSAIESFTNEQKEEIEQVREVNKKRMEEDAYAMLRSIRQRGLERLMVRLDDDESGTLRISVKELVGMVKVATNLINLSEGKPTDITRSFEDLE